MENVINNYKALLLEYDYASEVYQNTGLTRLLAHAIDNLERFERAFVECWSLEELLELQVQVGIRKPNLIN